jgi:hypothetical protein
MVFDFVPGRELHLLRKLKRFTANPFVFGHSVQTAGVEVSFSNPNFDSNQTPFGGRNLISKSSDGENRAHLACNY